MPTEIATLRSHKSLLEHALVNRWECVFILEDDIDFCDNFREKLSQCLSELPENWDCLHLAGSTPSTNDLIHYSSRLNKCLKSWGGYAYIVNSKAIPKLIETISPEQTQVDTYYSTIMPELNWFKTKEMLVYHLPGYSDIMECYRDIKELYPQLNK